jgi:hypothetical protein
LDILSLKINLRLSITKNLLDEQLAATIRREYPQHVQRGT